MAVIAPPGARSMASQNTAAPVARHWFRTVSAPSAPMPLSIGDVVSIEAEIRAVEAGNAPGQADRSNRGLLGLEVRVAAGQLGRLFAGLGEAAVGRYALVDAALDFFRAALLEASAGVDDHRVGLAHGAEQLADVGRAERFGVLGRDRQAVGHAPGQPGFEDRVGAEVREVHAAHAEIELQVDGDRDAELHVGLGRVEGTAGRAAGRTRGVAGLGARVGGFGAFFFTVLEADGDGQRTRPAALSGRRAG
jgi:hypothetical protein